MTDMRDVDHTHPHTDRPFGGTVAFERGAVAADGGRDARESGNGATDADTDSDRMCDVSHTPPAEESDGVNSVFERGTEGRDETV